MAELLKMDTIFLYGVMGLITVSFMLYPIYKVYFMGKKEKKEKKQYRSTFFENLDNKFKLGWVKDIKDVEMLRNSIERDFEETYLLIPLLEDYLKHLVDSSSTSETGEETQKSYEFIAEIINKEKEERPFAGIPDDERRLLMSVKDAIELKDDKKAKNNINELGSLIKVRSKTYLKTQKVNRWALPIAIIGTLVSMIFGIMNILNRIDASKLEMMMKNSLSG